MVWVDCDRKNWFRPILAGKSGFGRFWPKKVIVVDFDWEHWFLTELTGLGRFWPKKVVLVDVDRKNWFRPILAKKM